MTIEVTLARPPHTDEPMVIACFSYRYDAHLVPALIQSLRPIVHGWAALDDRAAEPWYSSEPDRRRALLDAARAYGAEWTLIVDPDERYEDRFAARMRDLATAPDRPIWAVDLFEMFAPDRYRTDGIWGGRTRRRLFPVTDDIHVPDQALHAHAFDYAERRPVRDSGISCYHLRMITPGRRRLRRDQYALLDPAREMQALGYDYLAMDGSAVLQPVAVDRTFSPPHVEDGGLWGPGLPGSSAPQADPLACRLNLIASRRVKYGSGMAADAGRLAMAAFPDDGDLPLLSAALELEAGRPHAAITTLDLLAPGHAAAAMPPVPAPAPLPNLRPCGGAGDGAKRRSAKAAISLRCGDERRRDRPVRATDAGGSGGLDRRSGRAGRLIVVNTGGGDVGTMLAPWIERLRLIELREPHLVGVARNIGIDASTAPIIAYLAGDCLAEPGWVAQRLAAHGAGAVVVPSRIVTAYPDNLVARVASATLHAIRWPGAAAMPPPAYGLSYARRLFEQRGYFPAGLGECEDTYLNERIHRRFAIDLTSDVRTRHRDPREPGLFYRDQRKRWFLRLQRLPLWRGLDDEAAERKRGSFDGDERLAASSAAVSHSTAARLRRSRAVPLVPDAALQRS